MRKPLSDLRVLLGINGSTEFDDSIALGHQQSSSFIPSEEIKEWLREYYSDCSNPNVAQGMFAVTYLLLRLLPESLQTDRHSVDITVRSQQLPIGAGLGSSAAFSVALAAACCLLRGAAPSPWQVPDAAQQRTINQWAFAAEVLLHGSPSGLDNTTSCLGGFVFFRRQEPQSQCERLQEGALPPLRLLLLNTRQPRSTRSLVARVQALKSRLPLVVDPVLDSIHAISLRFRELLQGTGEEPDGGRSCFADSFAAVSELMAINHQLLLALGVGHARLEAVRAVCEQHGYACKLTGAGGGGCAIALVSRCACEKCGGGAAEAEARLRASLSDLGVDCFESSLGREGVMWRS